MRALLLAALMAGTESELLEVKVPDAPARFEVTLQPVRVQVNGTFTQHLGTFATVGWSPRRHLALQMLGGGNWYNEESAFNGELVEKFRVEVQAASSMLWTWGLFGGVELEPFLGEFTLLQGARVQLGFVLSVGAGAGGTRHQLKPMTDTPATYGDTGARFMATAAAGLRLRVGEHFVARIELRDVGYSAAVTIVDGCNARDVNALVRRVQLWHDNSELSSGCQPPAPGHLEELFIAQNLLRAPGTEIIHNLGLALGAGVTF